jgi:hypothetical protein
MPPLENPRHESFAAFMAEGKSAGEAYELAGYKPSKYNRMAAGALLAKKPEIRERSILVATENAARLAASKHISKEKLIEWHHEVRTRGLESGQLAPAGTAIKEISILTGHRVERAEIGSPGEYENMSDEELERQLMERLAKLGFVRVDALVDFSPNETDAPSETE